MPPPKKATTKKEQPSQQQKQKKVVQFCKIVNKKNITPLATFKKDAPNLPEDCVRTDLRLSFMEVTDPSLPEIEVIEIVPAKTPIKKGELARGKTLKKNTPKKAAVAAKSLWADEFIPASSTADLIISPDSYHGFQEWLLKWKKYLALLAKAAVEEPPQKKKKKRRSRRFDEDSDDEDFVPANLPENDMGSTYILSGPVGCGKTSMVYLFAKEAGFNVIEMSASDSRSQGVMNKKLQGAIETFAVRGPGDIRSMFAAGGGGVQKRQTSSVSEVPAIGNNLILIDDADVFFDQDKGYWGKLTSFCNESKIPIILTCTNLKMVTENLQNVHVRHFKFQKKERATVSRFIKRWLKEKHPEASIGEEIIKEIVADARQDVRKAINNLQFNGGTLSKKDADQEADMPKFELSPQDLAELDCLLTKCKEVERIPSKVQWNAAILPNYDYVPDKEIMNSYEIPPVSNSNDLFIKDLSNLIASSRPSSYDDFDKRIQRQSTIFQRYSGRYAPMLPAVWDTLQRTTPHRPLKKIALYELPALSSIHKGFQQRMQEKPSRRRVLHPFDEVDNNLERALDQYGNLKNSIGEYNAWMEMNGENNKAAV